MTIDLADAWKEVFDFPDAERPYLRLARAYANMGMKDEEDAVMFLIKKRFGADADDSNSDKGQRGDGGESP